jgi:hypothetical protein
MSNTHLAHLINPAFEGHQAIATIDDHADLRQTDAIQNLRQNRIAHAEFFFSSRLCVSMRYSSRKNSLSPADSFFIIV